MGIARKTGELARKDVLIGSKAFIAVVSVLITCVVLDISLLRVYDIVGKGILPLETRELIFAAITVACFASQYLLLRILRPHRKVIENRSEALARVFYIVTVATLITIGAIMTLVLSEQFLFTYYDKLAMQAVLLSSYALCIVMIGFVVKQILSWLTLEKSMVVVILFVIGLASITFNSVVAMIDASLRLEDRPAQIRPFFGGSTDISKGKYDTVDQLYFYSFILSYVTAWIATATLLYTYSRKVGIVKYGLLVAAPLVFFLFQFSEWFLMIFSPGTTMDRFFLNSLNQSIIVFSKPVGGLMLGMQFWILARFATKDAHFRSFLIIAGFGMLFLFSSNQVILLSITPYPPFGLTAVIVLGLSSYLVMVGLYRSSVAVTGNRQLRHEIRQLATSETRLIEGIITGEKRKEIEDKVSRLVKNKTIEIEEETGSKPFMTEEDVKQHLEDVLREITAKKV